MFGARYSGGIASRRPGLGRWWAAGGSPWRVIIMIGAGTPDWSGILPGEACRAPGGAAVVRPHALRPLPTLSLLLPPSCFPNPPLPPRPVITQFVRTPHFQGRPSVFMAAATAALIPDLVYFSFFLFRNSLNLFLYVWTRPGPDSLVFVVSNVELICRLQRTLWAPTGGHTCPGTVRYQLYSVQRRRYTEGYTFLWPHRNK